MNHKQVTVNGNISVDEGIADLVLSLGNIPKIQTLESCQGGNGSMAFVYFGYDGSSNEFAEFIQDLTVKLRTHLDLCCEYKIRLEWLAGSESPIAEISVQPTFVKTLSSALSNLVATV